MINRVIYLAPLAIILRKTQGRVCGATGETIDVSEQVTRLRDVCDELHAERDILREEMQAMIKRPTIDWVGTDAPDPRDAYTTRINGHVVGIHSTEEAARNHAWALESYLGMHEAPAGEEG